MVNVIDTINPVVSLIGSAEINLTQGTTYTEQGATATDNSLESLTVIIGGDTVNVNVVGDYTITYTATDSSTNVHQIARSVHINAITYTLRYSNPTTDILGTLVNFNTYIPTLTALDTYRDFTISGHGSTYLNGHYSVWDCAAINTSYYVGNIFNNSGSTFESKIYNHTGTIFAPYPISQNITFPLSGGYTYSPNYTSRMSSNSIAVYYNTVATNAQSYPGEYFQIEFPFYVELSSYFIDFNNAAYRMTSMSVLGSKDNINYTYLPGFTTNSNQTATVNASVIQKNRYFRVIFNTRVGTENVSVKQLKLFGDVYTQD